MPALQVKECPAEVYERLRSCAARENRSISQQALTIIEEFLGMREGPSSAYQGTAAAFGDEGAWPRGGYAEKRRQAFARMEGLPAVPISEAVPSTVDLLASIREEEAR